MQASLNPSIHTFGQKGRGNTLRWKSVQSLTNLIKHTKISYLIASFTYHRLVLKWSTLGTWKMRYSKWSKISSFNSFCQEFKFWYLCTKGVVPQNLIWPCLEQVIIFQVEFNNETKEAQSWKSSVPDPFNITQSRIHNSRSLLPTKNISFWKTKISTSNSWSWEFFLNHVWQLIVITSNTILQVSSLHPWIYIFYFNKVFWPNI